MIQDLLEQLIVSLLSDFFEQTEQNIKVSLIKGHLSLS